ERGRWPALDLRQLPPFLRLDVAGRRRDGADEVLVQDELRVMTIDNGAKAQFLMPRRADLAHHDDIEGRGQCLRDLEADRNAAPRQREHNWPAFAIGSQGGREPPSGVAAITEKRYEHRLSAESACAHVR